MNYKITLCKNYDPEVARQRVHSFLVEWDNQLNELVEFLKSQGYKDVDITIEELPILKYSQFRTKIMTELSDERCWSIGK